MESLEHHLFFSTLTYCNEFLPVYHTSVDDIPFADFVDIDLLVKRLRNNYSFTRPFKYVCVSERGGKRHRPHFHILWILPKYKDDDFVTCLNLESILKTEVLKNWCRNVGGRRWSKVYKPLTIYQERWYAGKLHTNYDTHFVNPSLTTNGISDAAFYVLKYMLKANPYERYLYKHLKSSLTPDEFADCYSVVRSHCTTSKGVGSPDSPVVVNYILSCIERSDVTLGYPQYFNPDTGQSFPLCKYYRRKFLDAYHAYGFSFAQDADFEFRQMPSEQKILQFKEFDKMLNRINEHESQVFYDLM